MTAPTLPLAELTVVTEPGVYEMPAEVYHGDPVPGGSLSASGAKKLLPPSCPAKFAHERANGQEPKKEFDFGHAAHREVLGAGPAVAVVQADDWRTKRAREERDAARAEGLVPILAKDHGTVQAMAAALRGHPAAAALFDSTRGGKPEQSAFWFDEHFKIWRRARFDWFPVATGRRLLIPEYKSCRSADPDEALGRAVHDYRYHMSAAWYEDAARALDVADQVVMVFVFQEKDPPHVVTVAQLDGMALRIGRSLNRRAIEIYKNCTKTGRWPGYDDQVAIVCLPPWVEARYEKGFTP